MSHAVPTRTDPSRREALVDIVIVTGVSIGGFAVETALADHLPWGAEARGVVAVLAGAVAAVACTLRRHGRLGPLGLVRPRRWWTVPVWVVGIFATFVIAQGLLSLALQAVAELPEPDLSRYDFIRGNPSAALLMMLLLPLTAAIPEEILYRGFLLGRVEVLAGNGRWATAAAILGQALVFGSVHFQWGIGGVVFATVMGLVWGLAYVACGRNLWIVILAHSLAHVALVLQIYSSPG